MKAYFVSDTHLELDNGARCLAFQKLLQRIVDDTDVTHVFFLGDIFELWLADRKFFRRCYAKTLESIESLASQNIEVHFFEGNHDVLFGKYWTKKLKVKVHKAIYDFQIGGHNFRLEHGDLIDDTDKVYLRWRCFLRSWLGYLLCKWLLPSSALLWVSENYSTTNHKISSSKRRELHQRSREIIRAYSQKLPDSIDTLVCGHTHAFMDEVLGGKKIYNLGSWLDESYAYTVVFADPTNRQLLQWTRLVV